MRDVKRASKFMSLVLRHQPEKIGITLDSQGWVDLSVFMEAMARHGHSLTQEELDYVVENNDKKRFVVRDGRIRANQGHSVEVDLALQPKQPPARLYHGTDPAVLDSIRDKGLVKMSRNHVHLSEDVETATKVGKRRTGKPVILEVMAGDMWGDNHNFYQSENGVWLTDHVPSGYIKGLS